MISHHGGPHENFGHMFFKKGTRSTITYFFREMKYIKERVFYVYPKDSIPKFPVLDSHSCNLHTTAVLYNWTDLTTGRETYHLETSSALHLL